MLSKVIALMCFTGMLAAGLTACRSVETLYNCADICTTYADCVDKDYDVLTCTRECKSKAAESEQNAQRAAECQRCIDDKACLETFVCLDECVGIVP